MDVSVLSSRSKAPGLSLLVAAMLCSVAPMVRAGEQRIVLRDYVKQQWKNELVTYPFEAEKGQCHADSIRLTGPKGPVPVQVSDVERWRGSVTVKSAKLSFIADLAPLATDTYTVQYGPKPSKTPQPETDLKVIRGKGYVDLVTSQFGVRLLLGTKKYRKPTRSSKAPGPVGGMRLGSTPEGTWVGGSRMYGATKIAAISAELVAGGPVFGRVAIRYTYEGGNTLDLTVQVAAGDNTMRMETRVKEHQPEDGFNLILTSASSVEPSRALPPLVFIVQDECRKDRPCFMNPKESYGRLQWAEIPLKNYTAPKPHAAGLVTQLSPWEDWFTTFTQTRIRLKLANTKRELQIRSLDPGAWVEPRPIEAIFGLDVDSDPAKGLWAGWGQKLMPIMRATSGEVSLHVNAAHGVRKWTVSDCRSMPGVAALLQWYDYKPEKTFPPETRPLVNYRLNEVKDYVLEWPDEPGRHPLLFISRSELQERSKRKDADTELLAYLTKHGTAPSPESLPYSPNAGYPYALGAFLLSGESPEVGAKALMLARLHQLLTYDLYGVQFGCAGAPTPIFYDGVIDSSLVSKEDRPVLRAQMALFGYRLADPAVWSAERGYASGNQNMTVTWEISRGLVACAIPKHPMAKTWYAKAQRIMEHFLTHMVGPAGEWPEAMGGHGRTSIDMILAFAIASTNSGLHDYVNDPRVKRMVMYWAKMETPRDPRPRGIHKATPNRRYFPAMGRDGIGHPGGTCGAMARVTRKTDPDYSAAMQWAWQEEGASANLQHLGGFTYVSCDPHLPAKQPAWTSEVFPYAGAMLRHGLGTSDEHQVLLYCGDHFAAFYPAHTGGFASIFAYGKPVAGLFPGGYQYQEGYLTSSVGLARPLGSLEERKLYGYHGCPGRTNMWSWPKGPLARFGERPGRANVSAFSTLSRQDYAAVDVARHFPRKQSLPWRKDLPPWPSVSAVGKPPIDWRRQTLFLKDDDPAGTAYVLIRDTVKGVKGEQPTMWQMWTVSETLDTPANVKDVVKVLAKKPGNKILPARQLKGDRFTAIGQLGVDVEYYIASPSEGTNAPRHTLRWGTNTTGGASWLVQPEYQDLLHLQMPGDGFYYVAFFPRKRNTPAPTFSTLGGGTIIKTSGDFGTDYGFLSALVATASGQGASFRGTAASVQDRPSRASGSNDKGGLVLTLGAKGEVRYKAHGLAADFPAALRVGERKLTVELPAGIQPPAFQLMKPFPGGTVTVSAPGKWRLSQPLPGVTLTRSAAGFVLKVPTGLRGVTVVRAK